MKGIPIQQRGALASLDLLSEVDTPWIEAVIDELEAAVGRPWRELLDRLARLTPRTSAARHAAVIQALRTSTGGRSTAVLRGSVVRLHLLGRSALDVTSRQERLEIAAQALRTTSEQLEPAMWSDLPGERSVVLPKGRPNALEVAAGANLAIVQRTLSRCHELRLRVFGNARAIARSAALRGLVVTAQERGGEVELAVSGPLAVFHETTVYGRALGSLVRELVHCERFVLEARCDFGRGPALLQLRSPILLPACEPPRRYDSRLEARFAKDMAQDAPHWRVIREPSPVDAGGHLAFPDFLLEHRELPERRWWLEIVGYWTSAYLEHKLSTYRAANLANVILCIDARRALDVRDLPRDACIVRFDKTISIPQVRALIERT